MPERRVRHSVGGGFSLRSPPGSEDASEKDIQEVAERLGYDPAEMPKGVYMKESGQYSNEDFVAFGGYNAVRADLFGRAIAPLESNPTNLAMIRGTQTRRSEVARLQRELGSYTLQVERFKLALHEALKDCPSRSAKPPEAP